MIFSCSELVVSSIADCMTDSNLIDDDVVVIVVAVGEEVGELVSVVESSLRLVFVVI